MSRKNRKICVLNCSIGECPFYCPFPEGEGAFSSGNRTFTSQPQAVEKIYSETRISQGSSEGRRHFGRDDSGVFTAGV